MDAVTANYNSGTVSVLRNNGVGGLLPAVSVPAGSTPFAVTLGDIDQDGRLDILVASSGISAISLLRNTGGGSFAAPVTFAVGSFPSAVVVADA